MRVVRCLLILCVCAAVASCANRKPIVSPPAASTAAVPVVDVAAVVRHGCYHCLERALAAAQGEQAFEVAALLTLRAKELGLPYDDYRKRAGVAAPADPAFAIYLEVIDAAPVDLLTGERYLREPPAPRIDRDANGVPIRPPSMADRAVGWREALKTGPGSDIFRRYLDIAIGCSITQPAPAELTPAEHDVPLLRYRMGLCGRQPEDFRRFRDGDPEFVDADVTLGRIALNTAPVDLDEALRWMQSAHAAFPESPSIATLLGHVYDEREEWTQALATYDSLVAVMPLHREALLGRTIALSHLGRNQEAMATATRMIELGSWLIGEAYYWRAWNEFAIQQYQVAREDTDRAKARMINASVFVLSGLVEWNLLQLPTAESELEEALKMDFGRCDAARYLGRVRMQRNKPPEAIAAFRQAIQCFDLAISVRQTLIANIQAGAGSEATKARLIAGHQRAIDSSLADRAECQQNMANLEKRGTQ